MNSNKGEFGFSFKPRSWPLLRGQEIDFWIFTDGGILSIDIISASRILIKLCAPAENFTDTFTSAGINLYNDSVASPPFIRVKIKWTNGIVESLQINETNVPQFTVLKSVRIESPTFPLQDQLSTEQPDILTVCMDSVEYRNQYFTLLKSIAVQRTPKTDYQVHLELIDALKRLNRLLNFVEAGETIWLGTICAELRSLLHWDHINPGRIIKNHPLLLRVANIHKAPLPVFIAEPLPKLDERPESFAFRTPPSIKADCDICVLQDFQAWLDNDFCYIDGQKPFTAKKFIGECAVTMGPVHYDMELSNLVIHLAKSNSRGIHQITGIICKIGACTLNLGAWLLNSNGFPFQIEPGPYKIP